MSKPRLRGLVIGFGNVGRSVTARLAGHPEACIVAAADPSPEARAAAMEGAGLEAVASPEAVIDRVDFVVVASPNATHAAHVLLAARAGKAVLCEKPVALSLADGAAMADAVDRAGVINVVNYSLRYQPAFARVRSIIASGELGSILSAWSIRLRGFGLYAAGARHPAVVRSDLSGGWAVHHLCHSLDLLHWWLGPISTVDAATATTAPDKSEESIHALLRFASGACATAVDSVCGLRSQHHGVVGSRGSLVVEGEGGATVLRVRREGAAQDETTPLPPAAGDSGLMHFVECLAGRSRSAATIRDALPSLAAALAIRVAARSGAPVAVSVP